MLVFISGLIMSSSSAVMMLARVGAREPIAKFVCKVGRSSNFFNASLFFNVVVN